MKLEKLLPIILTGISFTYVGCSKKDSEMAIKSSNKAIESFVFKDLKPPITANIDESSKTINFIPLGADPTSLSPTIIVSSKAQISPTSLTFLNFTSPQKYTVTAEDGSTVQYTTNLQKEIASAKDIPTPPKYLCFYYAWPSVVNGSNGNTDLAINIFKDYDIVIFGGGLWKTSHGDYVKTKTIIAGLKELKPSIRIFGYIDLGVSTQNLSTSQLNAEIDGWQLMGVQGVFGDDFGYDFKVTRSRQNDFINYAHGKGLAVFANGWNIEDVLGGADCLLSGSFNDYYLMESFLISDGSYSSLQANIDKANAAYYYMKTKKIGIACVIKEDPLKLSPTSDNSDKFKQSWNATAMYNFDAFQFSNINLCSQNEKLYFYKNPVTQYGSSWIDVNWVRKVSNNRYERKTNTNTFFISGDGSTTGTGGH